MSRAKLQTAAGPKRAPAARPQLGFAEYAEMFNRDLKILVQDVAARYPHDANIYRARQRVMTVISMDPLYVIDLVGKYLFTYKEQVYALETSGAEAEKFFLDSSYDAELRAAVNQEKIDLVNYIMPKLKECVRALEADEKEDYKKRVVSLLDNYIEYLAAKLRK